NGVLIWGPRVAPVGGLGAPGRGHRRPHPRGADARWLGLVHPRGWAITGLSARFRLLGRTALDATTAVPDAEQTTRGGKKPGSKTRANVKKWTQTVLDPGFTWVPNVLFLKQEELGQQPSYRPSP